VSDLRKSFNSAFRKQQPAEPYDRLMEEASLFVARIIAELKSYGFNAQLDEHNTVVKVRENRLELQPRLLIRYPGRRMAETGALPDYVDFTIYASLEAAKPGVLGALGVGKTVENLDVTFRYFDGAAGGWSGLKADESGAVEQVAQILVERYAASAARNDQIKDFKNRVAQHSRALPRTQKPGWNKLP